MTFSDDDFAEFFRKQAAGGSTSPSWQDVGAEFEALTRTVGEVFRIAFESSESQSTLGDLRTFISSAIQDVDDLVGDSADAREAREQLVRLRERLRFAAIRAGDELRPELVKLLREVNAELRRRSGLDPNR